MKKVMLTFASILFISGTVHSIIEDDFSLEENKSVAHIPFFPDPKENFEAMITALQDRESAFKKIGKWLINNPAVVAGSTLTTSLVLTPIIGVPVAVAVYVALKARSPYYQYKWAKDTFIALGKEYQRTFKKTSYDAVQNAFVAFGRQDPCLYLILYAQDIGEKVRLLDAAVAALSNAQEYSYQDDQFFNDCLQLADAVQQLKSQYFDQMKIIQANKLYVLQLQAYAEQQQARYQQRTRQQERQAESWERARDRQAFVQAALRAPAARVAAVV